MKRYILLSITGIGVIVGLSIAIAANAVPGKNLSAVVEWTKNHPLLPQLKPTPVKYEEGYPDYTSQTHLGQATVTLNVWINSAGIVQEETLDYRNYLKWSKRTPVTPVGLAGDELRPINKHRDSDTSTELTATIVES